MKTISANVGCELRLEFCEIPHAVVADIFDGTAIIVATSHPEDTLEMLRAESRRIREQRREAKTIDSATHEQNPSAATLGNVR